VTASRALAWPAQRRSAELRVAFAAAVSFALHLGLFLYLTSHTGPRAPRKVNEVSLEVHEVERPKPPPVEQITKKVEPVLTRIVRPTPRRELPPPPNQTPPKEAPPPAAPPPIHIGVNLESTVAGGAFAAPVGNSMYGVAPVHAPVPAEVKPYWAANYVLPSRVSELPVLLDEVKAPYPAAAHKEGIEGEVILLLTIDDRGMVALVKRISGPGHGLDEAAEKAAAQFRFKPAKVNGLAVATSIRYVYSFEID
jgi:protein TonB